MTSRPILTGDNRTDKALHDVCRNLNSLELAIKKIKDDLANYKSEVNNKFVIMSDTFETRSLLVGDVEGGNYIEIKETGEIELHGTNLIQINNGELYLKNGSTTIRTRADSGTFYVENETAPSVWNELFSAF